MKKKTVQYTALILVSILLLLVGNRVATSDNPYFGGGYSSDSYYRAKILRFTKVESQVEEFGGMQNHYTQLEMDVLLLEGVMKGETVSISHRVDEDLTAKPYPYTEGEKVLVTFDFDQDDNVVWYLADHLREGYLFALVGAFFVPSHPVWPQAGGQHRPLLGPYSGGGVFCDAARHHQGI